MDIDEEADFEGKESMGDFFFWLVLTIAFMVKGVLWLIP